jgi:hypothetical protein
MEDEAYFRTCTAAIETNRGWTVRELENLGFTVLPSKANFLFARSDKLSGGELYQKLRENGVLVRHFDAPERIRDFCRISVGSMEQMEELVDVVKLPVQRALTEGGERMRTAEITRTTGETDIALQLELDGRGRAEIDSGVRLSGPHADSFHQPRRL